MPEALEVVQFLALLEDDPRTVDLADGRNGENDDDGDDDDANAVAL